MHIEQSLLTRTFNQFFNSEKSSGILILVCTLVSISIANSIFGEQYLNIWHIEILGLSIEHWVNDGLMAVFFCSSA
jgi:NhaA family Na+:H+ antiporter